MSSTLRVPSIPPRLLGSLWSPAGQHLGRGLGDLVVEGWDVASAQPRCASVLPMPSPGVLHLCL